MSERLVIEPEDSIQRLISSIYRTLSCPRYSRLKPLMSLATVRRMIMGDSHVGRSNSTTIVSPDRTSCAAAHVRALRWACTNHIRRQLLKRTMLIPMGPSPRHNTSTAAYDVINDNSCIQMPLARHRWVRTIRVLPPHRLHHISTETVAIKMRDATLSQDFLCQMK